MALIRCDLYAFLPAPGDDCIHVLKLEPSEVLNSPLRGSYTIDYLNNLQQRYDALSYTWGDPVFNHWLHIDTRTETSVGRSVVPITQNLDQVLRYLRSPKETRRLWIDAVCINQQDRGEKNTQVPLMSRIYREASRVLVWLGGSCAEGEALLCLDSISRYRKINMKGEKTR